MPMHKNHPKPTRKAAPKLPSVSEAKTMMQEHMGKVPLPPSYKRAAPKPDKVKLAKERLRK